MAKAANATTGAGKPKHPGGRPTKLTRELVDKAAKYKDEMAQFELISIVGLAVYLDVAESSIYLWRDLDTPLGKEFSETVKKIDTFQHYQALNRGLTGAYKAPIVQLVLGKNHGYVLKQETDLRVKEMPKPILGGESQESGDE